MKQYIGTKIIKAEPMTQYTWLTSQGGIYSNSTDGFKDQDGYKVEYEDGYVSWSPKDVFEKAYVEIPMTLTDEVDKILLAAINGKPHYEVVWDAIRLGISYQVGLPKTEVQEFTAELKTMKEIGRYLVVNENNNIHFFDIEIEPEDNTKSIYQKIAAMSEFGIKSITKL